MIDDVDTLGLLCQRYYIQGRGSAACSTMHRLAVEYVVDSMGCYVCRTYLVDNESLVLVEVIAVVEPMSVVANIATDMDD